MTRPELVAYDRCAYELNWLPDIFATEAALIVEDAGAAEWTDVAGHLLDEAFTGRRPAEDLRVLVPRGRAAGEGFLRRLIDDASTISQAPRLRAEREPGDSPADHDLLASLFEELIGKLDGYGYLDHRMPREGRSAVLEGLVAVSALWPLTASRGRWSPAATGRPDLLLRLIAAFDALVARPRLPAGHEGASRSGSYSVRTGRALYRAHTNRNFRLAGVPLRISDADDQGGRLVAARNAVDD